MSNLIILRVEADDDVLTGRLREALVAAMRTAQQGAPQTQTAAACLEARCSDRTCVPAVTQTLLTLVRESCVCARPRMDKSGKRAEHPFGKPCWAVLSETT